MGEIGSAIHRIVIKSILEIVQSIKQGNDNNISKQDAKQTFVSNAEQEIDANWKTYALAGIESSPSYYEGFEYQSIQTCR